MTVQKYEIQVAGRVIVVGSEKGEAQVKRIAEYVETRMQQIARTAKTPDSIRLALMTALSLAKSCWKTRSTGTGCQTALYASVADARQETAQPQKKPCWARCGSGVSALDLHWNVGHADRASEKGAPWYVLLCGVPPVKLRSNQEPEGICLTYRDAGVVVFSSSPSFFSL